MVLGMPSLQLHGSLQTSGDGWRGGMDVHGVVAGEELRIRSPGLRTGNKNLAEKSLQLSVAGEKQSGAVAYPHPHAWATLDALMPGFAPRPEDFLAPFLCSFSISTVATVIAATLC